MRTPARRFACLASRTLMNEPSSLNHSPELSWSPIRALMARMRIFCAVSSANGATHSPITKVATTNARPIRASSAPALTGDRPEARMTVYSELLPRCAST
jgi:hypothetical protein